MIIRHCLSDSSFATLFKLCFKSCRKRPSSAFMHNFAHFQILHTDDLIILHRTDSTSVSTSVITASVL